MTSAARVPQRIEFSSVVPQRLAIAIGGTATHPEMITGTSAEQKEIAKQTAEPLLPKLRGGCKSLIAHDNAA